MSFESPESNVEPSGPGSADLAVPSYGHMANCGTAPQGTDLFANVQSDAIDGDLLVKNGDDWIPYEATHSPDNAQPAGDNDAHSQSFDAEQPPDYADDADAGHTFYDYLFPQNNGAENTNEPTSNPADIELAEEIKPEPLAIAPSTQAEPAFEGFSGKLSDLDKEPAANEDPNFNSPEPSRATAGGSQWAEDPPEPSTPPKKSKDPLNNLLNDANPPTTGKELELSGDRPPTNEPPQSPPEPPKDPGDLPPVEPPNLPKKLPPPPPPPSNTPNVSLELSNKYWSVKDFWIGLGRGVLGLGLGTMGMATQKLEARGVVVESKGIFGQATKYNVNILNHSTNRTTKVIVSGAHNAQEAAQKATNNAIYRFEAIRRTI